MRRYSLQLALVAAFSGAMLAPAAARAQESLRPVLLSLLDEAQRGSCGKQLAPLVASSCQQQIGGLSKRLQSMGRPLNAQFKGVDAQGSVFIVQFERGNMTWLIAQAPSGQVTTFWTP